MAECDFVQAELTPLHLIPPGETRSYWQEFLDHGETENVLWELASMDIREYYERQMEDKRNRRFGFRVNGTLTGMVRISSRVNYEANGKVGYSVRPSMRGRNYAAALLWLVTEYCRLNGIKPVTACADIRNEASLKALRRAGFVETGRVFDWTPNPSPRKAVELILPY